MKYCFRYIKVYIFWKFTQCTMHWDKTQIIIKKISLKKNKRYKKSTLFSRAPTHQSFTFNLQLLYELKNMIHVSKTVYGLFNFQFRLIFIKVYIFVQQKAWILKRHNSFQNYISRKATHSFWRLKVQWYLLDPELPKTSPGDELFKFRKSKYQSFEYVTFSQ